MRANRAYGTSAAVLGMASALTVLAACSSGTLAAEGDGAITGTVVFEGQAPAKMPSIPMAANPECEAIHPEPVPMPVLVLDAEQHLANVLVHVTGGLPEGVEYPMPEEPVALSQQGCMYNPRVFGIRAGQPLEFQNPDKFLHNVHALPKVNTEFNRSMNSQRTEISTTFDKTEWPPFDIKCDIHAWMQAFCAVFDHPYFAVTDEAGHFKIEGLPPGEYEIEAWHERLGSQKATVTVTAAGEAVADFAFKRPGT